MCDSPKVSVLPIWKARCNGTCCYNQSSKTSASKSKGCLMFIIMVHDAGTQGLCKYQRLKNCGVADEIYLSSL